MKSVRCRRVNFSCPRMPGGPAWQRHHFFANLQGIETVVKCGRMGLGPSLVIADISIRIGRQPPFGLQWYLWLDSVADSRHDVCVVLVMWSMILVLWGNRIGFRCIPWLTSTRTFDRTSIYRMDPHGVEEEVFKVQKCLWAIPKRSTDSMASVDISRQRPE